MPSTPSLDAKVEIDGNFFIGHPPKGLLLLHNILTHQKDSRTRDTNLHILINSSWFDITILSTFVNLIRLARPLFHSIHLKFAHLTTNQLHFLWRIRFWNLIQANCEGSNVYCEPDPWIAVPTLSLPRSNFTQFFFHDLTSSFDVKPMVVAWETQIEQSAVFPYIANTDTIQSREYLFLLIWELLQNANEHSSGRSVIFGGQVFLARNACRNGLTAIEGTELLLNSLAAQYSRELANSRLPGRSDWLKRHSSDSFLLISCVDDGIGISTSIKNRDPKKCHSDDTALAVAFDSQTLCC